LPGSTREPLQELKDGILQYPQPVSEPNVSLDYEYRSIAVRAREEGFGQDTWRNWIEPVDMTDRVYLRRGIKYAAGQDKTTCHGFVVDLGRCEHHPCEIRVVGAVLKNDLDAAHASPQGYYRQGSNLVLPKQPLRPNEAAGDPKENDDSAEQSDPPAYQQRRFVGPEGPQARGIRVERHGGGDENRLRCSCWYRCCQSTPVASSGGYDERGETARDCSWVKRSSGEGGQSLMIR
jgi:hypothetical protein